MHLRSTAHLISAISVSALPGTVRPKDMRTLSIARLQSGSATSKNSNPRILLFKFSACSLTSLTYPLKSLTSANGILNIQLLDGLSEVPCRAAALRARLNSPYATPTADLAALSKVRRCTSYRLDGRVASSLRKCVGLAVRRSIRLQILGTMASTSSWKRTLLGSLGSREESPVCLSGYGVVCGGFVSCFRSSAVVSARLKNVLKELWHVSMGTRTSEFLGSWLTSSCVARGHDHAPRENPPCIFSCDSRIWLDGCRCCADW